MPTMVEVCDGPACRLRAADLGLGGVAAAPVGCLGHCDAPVVARVTGAAGGGRPLALTRPGAPLELCRGPGAQRGPDEPILLRDVFLADQASYATAERR